MYDYLKEQYGVWMNSQQYLEDWAEQVQPLYRKLTAQICQCENYLTLEAACNAYAGAAERHGFFAGYAWFLCLCRAAADYFPAGGIFSSAPR